MTDLIYIFRFIGHQSWIPFRIRNYVLNLLFPIQGNRKSFSTNFYGYKYLGDTSSFIDRQVYFFGAYEKYILDISSKILKNIKEPIILDIGANVGHHSLFFSSLAKEVHAFEPFKNVYSKLCSHIEENKIENIYLHKFGLGNKNEFIQYYAPSEDQDNKGTGSFIQDYNTNLKAAEVLEIKDAQRFVKSLKLEKIDYIKIDVEGYEKNVLEGIAIIINEHRPYILLEFSDQTASSFENLEELYKFFPDYSLYYLNPKSVGFFGNMIHKHRKFNLHSDRGNILCSPQRIKFLEK